MTEQRVLRHIIECEHEIDNYVDDEPTVFERFEGDFAPAGIFVTVTYADESGAEYEAELWTGHTPSTGSRQPPARTKAHSRGYIVDPRTNRAIGFASSYELTCILFLMANIAVVDIEDQPPAVTYLDADGKKRSHTYDIRATLASGDRHVFPVKEADQVEKTKIKDVIELTKPYLEGFADKVCLLTDRTLTRELAWNCKSVVGAQKRRVEADCDRMRDLVKDICGTVSAFKLSRNFERFADGLNAIWCLIYDGVLEHTEPQRKLIDAPWVRVRANQE